MMEHQNFAVISEHVYQTHAGKPALKVTRLESSSGEKSFFQENFDTDVWTKGKSRQDIAPLYFHEWGKEEAPIFIVEGEKCADRLKSLGVAATTVPGGAKNWKTEYAQFFFERDVIIIPDNDEPGQAFATDIENDLEGICKTLVVVHLPDLNKGEDIYDWLERGSTLERLMETVKNQSVSISCKEVREFETNQKTGCPYPLHLLPQPVKSFVKTLEAGTDASPPVLAQACLAVLSALAGSFVTVRGETMLNDFYVIIGRSGARKTTGQKYGRRLLRAVLDKREDLCVSVPGKDSQTQRLAQIEDVSNFSVEGLEEIFVGSGVSALVVPGEYKQVFDIGKRTTQGNTISTLVSLYDGQPIKTTLRGRQFAIPNHCLTILSVSTPTWFTEALKDEAIASGFLNRHIVVMAEIAEMPLVTECSPNPIEWQAVVDEFSGIPLPRTFEYRDGRPNWFASQTNLVFENVQAENLWTDYYYDLHRKLREGSDQEADIIARENIHAIKLAGIKAFAERRINISEADLLFGIEWARASSHAIEYLVVNSRSLPEDKAAVKLFTFIQAHWQKHRRGTSRSDISRHFGGKQSQLHIALECLLRDRLVHKAKDLFFPADFRASGGGHSDKYM